MRFLTNENIPRSLVDLLRERGHDVLSARESLRGEADAVILARAQAEQRILVTHDKDFGELAFRSRLPAGCGVVLFRLVGMGRERTVQRMLAAIESRADWEGKFAVVTETRIRLRSLPRVAQG